MLWTAFTLGLFGSLHCVGMCGPIALALVGSQPAGRWRMAGRVSGYNLGRITTYILLGLLLGVLGQGLFLVGLQRWLSFAAGATFLVLAFFSSQVESYLLRAGVGGRFLLFLKSEIARRLGPSARRSGYVIGLLNGFLPCGMVYLALVGALAMGNIGGGALYMLFFGLGTFPLMLGAVLAGRSLRWPLRRKLQQLYPVLLLALGGLLIVRGLQVDVPQGLSVWEALRAMPLCH